MLTFTEESHMPSKLTRNNIKHLNSLELFAGAGGLALGIHLAGFKHKKLVEWNPHAVKTLRLNCQKSLGVHPDDIILDDAKNVSFKDYSGQIDLLAGGPPCQPFSTAGKNLAHLDSRDMFPTFLNAIKEVSPKAILIENVKGLLRPRFANYFRYILKRIKFPFANCVGLSFLDDLMYLDGLTEKDFKLDEQYNVTYQLIDTADFGVPQRRERVIITAYRADLGISPMHVSKTHSKQCLLHDLYVTGDYWNRHGIKPIYFLGTQNAAILSKLKKDGTKSLKCEASNPWKTVRDAISDLPPPVERGEVELIPNHVQHPGARIYKGHIGSYHDFPAKALKAGTHGTPGGENILRIENGPNVRYFTTREAARLHTFPDYWTFNGETWGSCITQLGNAVPVQIGQIFAQKIASEILRRR